MTPVAARVSAQAKLNLYLRVSAPDESGYHPLETLFCRIALSDVVTVSVAASVKRLDLTGPRLPKAGLGPVEKNLAWRAAEAYAALTGFPDGFEISIEKHIPVGGGLGGGSANAGGVLRALNALNPDPVGALDLLRLAGTLGADVPFLTQDVAPLALGRRYGDQLEMLRPLPSRPVWLVLPDVAVQTASAYRWLDETDRPIQPFQLTADQVATWDAVAKVTTNDFEHPVAERVPIIRGLLAGLRSSALREVLGESAIVLMSGSGSTVAIIAGEVTRSHWSALPPVAGVEIVETQTAGFVEPVVLTH